MAILKITTYKKMQSTINATSLADEGFLAQIEEREQM
jgi:hypothetical protein